MFNCNCAECVKARPDVEFKGGFCGLGAKAARAEESTTEETLHAGDMGQVTVEERRSLNPRNP